MSVTIKIRRGTSAQWADSLDPLFLGELGYDTESKVIKIGDGTTLWGNLDSINKYEISEIAQDSIYDALTNFVSTGENISVSYSDEGNYIILDTGPNVVLTSDLETALSSLGNTIDEGFVPLSSVGNPDGVATLDSDGKIPDSEIPDTIARDSELFSGSYNDLSDKPNIPTGPIDATPTATGSVYGLTDGNTSGTVSLGFSSLTSLAGGSNNIAIGNYALTTISTSFANVAVGNSSLKSIIGNGNTSFGATSGFSALSGDNNTFLGRNSGSSFSSGSNNTIIGYNSTPSSSSVDNEITIGNDQNDKFRIPGLGISWTTSNVPTASSWNYIGSMSSTSGSSVSFTGINGEYKELLLTFHNVLATTSDLVQFRINGDSNNSSYDMSSTYSYGGNTWMGNPIFNGGVPTLISFDQSSGSLRITNANTTNQKAVSLSFRGRVSSWITSSYVPNAVESLAGAYVASSVVNSLNISMASGSFQTGTWKLWGFK